MHVRKTWRIGRASLATGGLLADFEVRELFERAHYRRVIPRAPAVCGAGVEQLLAGRGIRQRNAQLAAGLQRKVQIFLMELDAKAGIERALHHPLAVHLKDP